MLNSVVHTSMTLQIIAKILILINQIQMYLNLQKYLQIPLMILKIQFKKEFKKLTNKQTKIMKLFQIFINKNKILKSS